MAQFLKPLEFQSKNDQLYKLIVPLPIQARGTDT